MQAQRSIFLATGFVALLGITGAAAWAIWRNTERAQANSARLHARDLGIQAALGGIRANVYLTGILVRDGLLEVGSATDGYELQFAEIEDRILEDLEMLRSQGLGSEESQLLDRLVSELNTYALSTEELLSQAAGLTRAAREEVLRQRVGRRRDILALAERIETLAVASSTEQHRLSNEADDALDTSLGWIAALALASGLGVAVLTLARLRGLEAQSRRAEEKLRSLSAQLRTAQEQERKRLSRELHDQVGQMLTGLRMELSALSRGEAASSEVRAGLDHARGTAEQTLRIVRNIAMLLRPSMLDDLGLMPALQWLARELERPGKLKVNCNIDPGADALPDTYRTCIFRVAQEALTNAARHAGARQVDLEVLQDNGWVRVRVADNGSGFRPEGGRGKGLGLLGMEERARELDGQLTITSAPGQGTAVELRLPPPGKVEASTTHDYDTDHEGNDRGRSRDRADRVEAAL